VKILLFSVLAVAMIGLMVPSAFGENIWWTNSKDTVTIAFEKYDIVQGDAKNKVVIIEGFVSPKIEQLKQGDSLFAFLGDFAVYIDGERFGCTSYSGYTCAEPDPIQYDYSADNGYGNELPIWNRSHDYFEWRWVDDLSTHVKFTIFYQVYDNVTTNSQIELYFSPLADEMTNTVWKSKEYKLADLQQLNSGKSESSLSSVSEDQTSTPSSSGGGCLIATAAFGSEMAPQVQFLRELRDNTVLQTTSGTTFMNGFNQFYYSFSPYVADYERENPVFKEAVKVTLTPLLTSLTLLNYVDVDTEEEMLGYGIGIILLNVGMYFVAPAILVISIKNKLKK
jgi:hypothetical protein